MFFLVRHTLGIIENGNTEWAKLKLGTDKPPTWPFAVCNLACEQALCLGKAWKNREEGRTEGENEEPVHRPYVTGHKRDQKLTHEKHDNNYISVKYF